MAIKNGQIYAEFGMSANMVASVRKNFNRPESDLRPWETVAIVPEEAPILQGHPTMPKLWCRTKPVLSLDGSAVLGNRREPSDISLDADAFWLPYENSWNNTTGTWRAWVQRTPGSYAFVQPSIMERPLFDEISYRLGREIITTPQVRFTGTQQLFSDIASGTYQAVNFTLSFVLLLNAPVNGQYAIFDWGTQTPASMPETRPFVTVQERLGYGWGGVTGSVDPLVPISAMRPAFVTLVVSPPTVTLYVSTGPRNTYSTSASAEAGVGITGTPMQFVVGGSTVPELVDGDFSLLSLALWGKALSLSEVMSLNSTYASVWGASNEWS